MHFTSQSKGQLPLFKAESEIDPLLPQGPSAPEITGYGIVHRSETIRSSPIQGSSEEEAFEDREDVESLERIGSSSSLLWIIMAIFTIIVGLALFITLLIPGGLGKPSQISRRHYQARAEKLLEENPLIDGHDDLAILIRGLFGNRIYDSKFTSGFENGTFPYHVDIARLKKGKAGGSFWVAYVPCPSESDSFSDAIYVPVVAETLQQIDLLHRLTAKYSDLFSSPDVNSSSALTAFKDKKIISPFAIEGLHQIGNSFSNLRLYRDLNIKYATLTHNCHNAFADAALVADWAGESIKAPPFWGGVSDRGQLLIKEMNRIGMLVDLSHVSANTMIDVLGGRPGKWAGSLAPVLFSHSSAYAICPHPRNVPDDVLELVKRTNSVVMVNFSPDFISCVASDSSNGLPETVKANATLAQVAKHITYIGDKIGYGHVGIGSDYDGIEEVPTGLEDVSKFPDLIAELLKSGVSDDDVIKLLGGNVLRVWADADQVAAKLQKDGVLPVEDNIKGVGAVL
ncbi:hypothetical protein MMC07_002672 [Pseudocyphellaria aurata]|nr:hypothetical protein [Pseudocyphellaria aurata]